MSWHKTTVTHSFTQLTSSQKCLNDQNKLHLYDGVCFLLEQYGELEIL